MTVLAMLLCLVQEPDSLDKFCCRNDVCVLMAVCVDYGPAINCSHCYLNSGECITNCGVPQITLAEPWRQPEPNATKDRWPWECGG